LNVVDLVAPFVPVRRVRWDIGEPVNGPLQGNLPFRDLELERNVPHGGDAIVMKACTVVEARHAHTVLAQALQIDIGDSHLRVREKPVRLGEKLPVLVNHAVPVPGEIRGGLAEACCRVDISRKAFGRLAGAKQPPVVGFCHRDVAGRQVHKHCGAGKCGVAARRDRGPEVLAKLHRIEKSG